MATLNVTLTSNAAQADAQAALDKMTALVSKLGIAQLSQPAGSTPVISSTGTVVGMVAQTPRMVTEDFTNGLFRLYDICRQALGIV